MTREELATAIADHAAPHSCIGGYFKSVDSEGWPCLPYRLAEALKAVLDLIEDETNSDGWIEMPVEKFREAMNPEADG